MYSSCRLSSYIPKEEKIITKNIVYINNEKIYDDKEYKNLIYTNENYKLLGFPVGLFLYEKIQENPERYFEELKDNNSKTSSLIEDIFSKKSVRKLKKNYILLNNKIKDEYSEKPVFFNQEYLEKSNKNLINYFQEKGYLDVRIDNNVNIENYNAILEYKINTGDKKSW